MQNKLPNPILITGCARSGTSMVAGIINLCGAFGGDMRKPNKNNAKGMFENAKIVEQIVKPYLRDIGVDPMGQYPLPEMGGLSIPRDWKGRVEQVMIDEGYKTGPWMYKGAKMCLTWPIWDYAFPNGKWIIVRREADDIVESCMKTNFMCAFNNVNWQKAVGASTEAEGWMWWIKQHEDRFREMINQGLNVKVVWPDRMVKGDYTQIYDTIDWLGLKWNSEALVSFVDPRLWKSRNKKEIAHG